MRRSRNSLSSKNALQPKVFRNNRLGAVLLLSNLLLISCALITGYDPTSYKNATDLKAQSMLVIDMAKDPPGPHADEIANLRLELEKAYQYENGKGDKNLITVKQWELLKDPEKHLIGGFLRKWEDENGPQSEIFREEFKSHSNDAFDEIIKLENHKVKD